MKLREIFILLIHFYCMNTSDSTLRLA